MSEDDKDVDWLEGDTEQLKAEQKILALEAAQLYEVFVQDPRAKQLLADWEEKHLRTTTPVESSVQRYAYDEAQREFVRGITRNVKLLQEFRE